MPSEKEIDVAIATICNYINIDMSSGFPKVTLGNIKKFTKKALEAAEQARQEGYKTLRDEIAIAAMQSFLITDKEREFEDIADFSYRMADEMLVAKRFIERDEHK